MPGIVHFSEIGEAGVPSPSVWADCPKTLLNDKGLGHYVSTQFAGDVGSLPGLPEDGDSATYSYNDGTQDNRAMDIVTGSTDNNAASIFTRPLGPVAKNSGKKVWFEADVALAATADQGVFVGLAELAALDRDVVADDAGGLASESLIGFQCLTDDQDAFDAVYRKDDGSVVTVLSDVTNATAIPEDERAAVTANEFVKLGVRFNGRHTLSFYVNGYEVATKEVDPTFDMTKEYGGILAVKTGAASARTVRTRFIRAAAQVRT